jgi:Flp pilus assembly CpaF family ATPase
MHNTSATLTYREDMADLGEVRHKSARKLLLLSSGTSEGRC